MTPLRIAQAQTVADAESFIDNLVLCQSSLLSYTGLQDMVSGRCGRQQVSRGEFMLGVAMRCVYSNHLLFFLFAHGVIPLWLVYLDSTTDDP